MPPENMPIWRAQINFVTSSTSDAGSDDNVKVELRSDNATFINSYADDFEPGSRTYDLRLENISKLSDIDFLRVSKTGDDGWTIARMQLIINNTVLFDQLFQPRLVLDNEGGHATVFFIDDFFMRQRAEWMNYQVPTRPNVISINDIRWRIESLFGDFVSNSDDLILAEGQGVQVYTLNANTWHVHVPLEVDKDLWNPDLDLDFDLSVFFVGVGFITVKPDFQVTNIVVDESFGADGPHGTGYFLEHEFLSRLNQMLKNFTYRAGSGIFITPNGDLVFNPLIVVTEPDPLVLPQTTSEQA